MDMEGMQGGEQGRPIGIHGCKQQESKLHMVPSLLSAEGMWVLENLVGQDLGSCDGVDAHEPPACAQPNSLHGPLMVGDTSPGHSPSAGSGGAIREDGALQLPAPPSNQASDSRMWP